MNILFLDFDGCINTITNKLIDKDKNELLRIDSIPQDNLWYQRKLVSNVNVLCDRYQLKVVVSSSWRQDYSLGYLQVLMRYMRMSCQIIDFTTTNMIDYDHDLDDLRSRQISLWLNQFHNYVDDYLVMDDVVNAGINHEHRFINPDPSRGFDNECYFETIRKYDDIFKIG